MSELELRRAVKRRKKGEEWCAIFPEVAQLKLDTQGDGIVYNLRIKKDAHFTVKVVNDGEHVSQYSQGSRRIDPC